MKREDDQGTPAQADGSGSPHRRHWARVAETLAVLVTTSAGVLALIWLFPSTSEHSTAPPAPAVTAPPTSAATPSSPGLPSPLDQYVADCEKGVSNWKVGQVKYPGTLPLQLGTEGLYFAEIDVREHPLPAEKVIPGPDPQSRQIAIQCVLSAQVVGDSSMVVTPAGWTSRVFNPVGIQNWSWRVTGKKLGIHQLELQLQPAVTISGRIVPPGGSPHDTVTFQTQVDVDGSVAQYVADWLSDWKVLVPIGAGIFAAILLFPKWGESFGQALLKMLTPWRKLKQALTRKKRHPTGPEEEAAKADIKPE